MTEAKQIRAVVEAIGIDGWSGDDDLTRAFIRANLAKHPVILQRMCTAVDSAGDLFDVAGSAFADGLMLGMEIQRRLQEAAQ